MWLLIGALFLTVGIALGVCGLVACCASGREQENGSAEQRFPLIEVKKIVYDCKFMS
jgi:hypothetical protein